MFHKWLVFNCATLFVAMYLLQFHDAFNKLIELDHTYVSFFIMAQYVLISAYVGFKGKLANFKAVRYYANMFPLVGMVGTLIAVMSVLRDAQVSGATKLSEYHGLYSIFTTTLFGVFFLGMVSYQLGLVFGDHENAE